MAEPKEPGVSKLPKTKLLTVEPTLPLDTNPDNSELHTAILSPAINPEADRLGMFDAYLAEATSSLHRLVEQGYWTRDQAQEYAKGYVECKNAWDVLSRNSLPKNIAEDTPLSYTWEYPPESAKSIYEHINQLVHFDNLNSLRKSSSDKEALDLAIADSTQAIAQLFPEETGIQVDLRNEFSNFWRVRFSRTIHGEEVALYLNIHTPTPEQQEQIAVLAYEPATEILYGFQDLQTLPLMDEIISSHPRLNIHLPPGIELKIMQRKKAEKEYKERTAQLSLTQEIQPTTKIFKEGTYVKQKDVKVQNTSEGTVGTTGVGPCVTVCTRGYTQEGARVIGLAHVDAGQDTRSVLTNLVEQFEQKGVPKGSVEMYLVGGWTSAEELQRRMIALSDEFPIKGVRINMKDKDMEGGKRDYIDVVVDVDGQIYYGENGEVFKATEFHDADPREAIAQNDVANSTTLPRTDILYLPNYGINPNGGSFRSALPDEAAISLAKIDQEIINQAEAYGHPLTEHQSEVAKQLCDNIEQWAVNTLGLDIKSRRPDPKIIRRILKTDTDYPEEHKWGSIFRSHMVVIPELNSSDFEDDSSPENMQLRNLSHELTHTYSAQIWVAPHPEETNRNVLNRFVWGEMIANGFSIQRLKPKEGRRFRSGMGVNEAITEMINIDLLASLEQQQGVDLLTDLPIGHLPKVLLFEQIFSRMASTLKRDISDLKKEVYQKYFKGRDPIAGLFAQAFGHDVADMLMQLDTDADGNILETVFNYRSWKDEGEHQGENTIIKILQKTGVDPEAIVEAFLSIHQKQGLSIEGTQGKISFNPNEY